MRWPSQKGTITRAQGRPAKVGKIDSWSTHSIAELAREHLPVLVTGGLFNHDALLVIGYLEDDVLVVSVELELVEALNAFGDGRYARDGVKRQLPWAKGASLC